LEELRRLEWHQELGRKFCAAYIAQQQGITVATAMGAVALPVGELWLQLAEIARTGSLDLTDDAEKQLRQRIQ
jgi:hypothetical protein